MAVTLVLDANGRVPLGHLTLEEAITDLLLGKSFPLVAWEGRDYHSEHLTVQPPKVVCRRGHEQVSMRVPNRVSNKFLFARDSYRCQYCGLYHRRYRRDLPPELWLPAGVPLTRDHVKPTSRFHGRTELECYRKSDRWENVTTACRRCNEAKGSMMPWECGMYPLTTPVKPSGVMLTFPDLLDPEQLSFVGHLLD